MKDVQLIEESVLGPGVLYRFTVSSLVGTQSVAGAIAAALRPGMVIGLSGPLGAGKTELIRALVSALGGGDDVSSPTFVLETRYDLQKPKTNGIESVRHWDLYRLGAGATPLELFDAPELTDAVTFIEWCERSSELQDLLSLRIMLAFGRPDADPEQFRTLTIESSDGSFGTSFRLKLK